MKVMEPEGIEKFKQDIIAVYEKHRLRLSLNVYGHGFVITDFLLGYGDSLVRDAPWWENAKKEVE